MSVEYCIHSGNPLSLRVKIIIHMENGNQMIPLNSELTEELRKFCELKKEEARQAALYHDAEARRFAKNTEDWDRLIHTIEQALKAGLKGIGPLETIGLQVSPSLTEDRVKVRKERDNKNWPKKAIAALNALRKNSTTRQIMEKIYELYPDEVNRENHLENMSKLSTALSNKIAIGKTFKREKNGTQEFHYALLEWTDPDGYQLYENKTEKQGDEDPAFKSYSFVVDPHDEHAKGSD